MVLLDNIARFTPKHLENIFENAYFLIVSMSDTKSQIYFCKAWQKSTARLDSILTLLFYISPTKFNLQTSLTHNFYSS